MFSEKVSIDTAIIYITKHNEFHPKLKNRQSLKVISTVEISNVRFFCDYKCIQ